MKLKRHFILGGVSSYYTSLNKFCQIKFQYEENILFNEKLNKCAHPKTKYTLDRNTYCIVCSLLLTIFLVA